MAGEVQALNRFHEWSLSRQQRRLRRLVWLVAAIGALAAIALVALSLSLGDIRSDVARLSRSSTGGDVGASGATSELASLREEVASLRTSIERLETADPPDRPRALRRVSAALSGLEDRLVQATDCLEGALLAVHQGLEGLLDRSLTAGAYIRTVQVPDC